MTVVQASLHISVKGTKTMGCNTGSDCNSGLAVGRCCTVYIYRQADTQKISDVEVDIFISCHHMLDMAKNFHGLLFDFQVACCARTLILDFVIFLF